ncbi:ribosomal protein S30 [uncultured archaeal virus]|jgi:ribosomal protein S30|uniref:Ribosomal protein S30 n=1 Tax=uncultured archaeal virus TaxID=1960247 RepID=A0A1S5Y312_9VIRU|nr:ribosomal protein S30 [uncultured archaeal virus]
MPKGSHGSLAKAGKVRFKGKSPKDRDRYSSWEKPKKRKKPIPRIRNRRNFIRRIGKIMDRQWEEFGGDRYE